MNNIHPTAIVDKSVTLGSNNYVGPYCYIRGNTIIGDNNRFEAFCSIGTPPQDRIANLNNVETSVIIGNSNIFREYTQVHNGTIHNTLVGNNCMFLVNTHISHDSIIEDSVTIGNNSVLGGHTHVMCGSNIGLSVIIHQYSIIGAYSMLGMSSVVTKTSTIEPGNIYLGSPAKFLKLNKVGLERNNIATKELLIHISNYNKLKNKI